MKIVRIKRSSLKELQRKIENDCKLTDEEQELFVLILLKTRTNEFDNIEFKIIEDELQSRIFQRNS